MKLKSENVHLLNNFGKVEQSFNILVKMIERQDLILSESLNQRCPCEEGDDSAS